MTSNLGSQMIQDLAGEADYDTMKKTVMDIVIQHFRPEFINRIDETVVFHPLGKEQIHAIATLQIERLQARLREKNLSLIVSEKVLDYLAKEGYDPVYGARPLKRAIQQYLENPLATDVLSANFLPGDVVKADMDKGGNKVVFKKAWDYLRLWVVVAYWN